MKTLRLLSVAAASFGIASVVSADTVDMEYTGISGALSVSVTGEGTFSAGHMNHTVYIGANPVGSFQSFCIELGEFANNGVSTYDIVDLTDAPDPDNGSPYSQAQADAVIDVVTKAISLGWIDINLQNAGGTSEQISAIQGGIWAALFGGATSTDVGVQQGLDDLSNESIDAGTRNLMAARLMAAVTTGEQDMLYIVPLPSAALAGIGLLGMCMGVRAVRRR